MILRRVLKLDVKVHTRFKVTESNYQFLKSNNDKDLIIEVIPKKGKHPRGTYEIPNIDALRFIDSKRSSFNWKKNKNFHQDAVPIDLRKFFTYKYITYYINQVFQHNTLQYHPVNRL